MHVLLDNDEVVLYLASQGDVENTYVWVLTLEPYAGPTTPASSKSKAKTSSKPSPPPRNHRTRSSSSSSSSSTSSSSSSSSSSSCSSSSSSGRCSGSTRALAFEHPIAKLPWFKRRPPSEIRKVRANSVLMRLRVVPAYFIHADGGVDNDGYLLSHGLYNFDLRGLNEQVIATSVD